MWRRPQSSKPVLLTVALAGLFLTSWTPFDWLISRPLEIPYPKTFPLNESAVQAIVIPASSVAPARPSFPVALPDTSTYARCRYAAYLYKQWKQLPIFVSGGNALKPDPPFAEVMAAILISEGVPKKAITLETRSLNTHENAVYTADLLRARGIREIAVIAEADSMLRLDLCFRKEGMAVVPAPFRHRSVTWNLEDLLPSRKAVERNERSLHEMLGIAAYALRGWL